MITCLDDAVHLSSDPPDTLPLQTSFLHHTSNPGWPSLQIPPEILATALGLHGTTYLAQIFDCSVWTVCCRALDYGFAEPGPPVYVEYEDDDGLTYQFYTSSTGATSDISDDKLDIITSQIVNTFPNFGHHMIDGHLKHLGHPVPQSQVQASYAWVHGAPASLFGPCRIQGRVCSVPGPNSLCHHDGQHGKSPTLSWLYGQADEWFRSDQVEICVPWVYWWVLATGYRRNNNQVETVFPLFQDMISIHGMPSHMRGDHGVENGIIAR